MAASTDAFFTRYWLVKPRWSTSWHMHATNSDTDYKQSVSVTRRLSVSVTRRRSVSVTRRRSVSVTQRLSVSF